MAYNYPKDVPLLKILFNAKGITKNPIKYHKSFFKELGNSFCIPVYRKKKFFMTRSASMARKMLVTNHKSFEKSILQTQMLAKYIGHGLLTSNGAYWLKQRRLIQPAFHKQKLEALVKIINDTVEEEIGKIKTNTYEDAYPYMYELTFNVVAKSLFTYSADSDTLLRLKNNITNLQLFFVKELRQPFLKFWFKISGQNKRADTIAEDCRAIIKQLLVERRKSNETFDDLLDMLINSKYEDDGTHMTDETLIDEILILFIAGHETTANALTGALGLLSKHPEYIEKIHQEANEIATEKLSFDIIRTLPITKAVIDESLRLYPPAWMTDRVAKEDIQLDEFHIAKDTMIGLSLYEIHRNESHWEKPNEFYPEHFMGENAKQHKEFYYPFGGGPRLCIGNNFALFEMLLVARSICSKFELEPTNKPIVLEPLVTLKLKNVFVKFKRR